MSLLLAQTMLGGPLTIPFPPSVPPTSGLKTLMYDWWDFEGSTLGNHAGNSSGISTPSYVTGKIGNGVSNQAVAPGGYLPWSAANSTYNVWFKISIPITGSTVISLIDSPYHDDNVSVPTVDGSAGLHIDFATGKWGIFKRKTGSGSYVLEGPTSDWPIPQDEWFMVTFRFRNSDDLCEVGINGNMTSILNGYISANLPLPITGPGTTRFSSSGTWVDMDMLGLWAGGSAMSNSQVQQLANGGAGISYSDIP